MIPNKKQAAVSSGATAPAEIVPQPVAVLGGTGKLGSALANRWAAAGIRVIVGSRDPDLAARVADDLTRQAQGTAQGAVVTGADNLAAASAAQVVVLAVPFAAQAKTLARVQRALNGKVLVSTVVPLDASAPEVWRPPPAGSAAMQAQQQLGPDTPVATAFQNVAARGLVEKDHRANDCVLVCSDDPKAKLVAIRLATSAGRRGLDAGPLSNAGVIEGLTAVLIGLNRRHGGRDVGLCITGLSIE